MLTPPDPDLTAGLMVGAAHAPRSLRPLAVAPPPPKNDRAKVHASSGRARHPRRAALSNRPHARPPVSRTLCARCASSLAARYRTSNRVSATAARPPRVRVCMCMPPPPEPRSSFPCPPFIPRQMLLLQPRRVMPPTRPPPPRRRCPALGDCGFPHGACQRPLRRPLSPCPLRTFLAAFGSSPRPAADPHATSSLPSVRSAPVKRILPPDSLSRQSMGSPGAFNAANLVQLPPRSRALLCHSCPLLFPFPAVLQSSVLALWLPRLILGAPNTTHTHILHKAQTGPSPSFSP